MRQDVRYAGRDFRVTSAMQETDARDGQRGAHDDHAQGVGQDVTRDHGRRTGADCLRRFDELAPLQREDVRPNDARQLHPAQQADDDDHQRLLGDPEVDEVVRFGREVLPLVRQSERLEAKTACS